MSEATHARTHARTQDGIASHGKRQRMSCLASKGSGKRKLDRLNYLFEAIEADKASDSETAHGTDSRGSQGDELDSARPLCTYGAKAFPSGVILSAA